VIDLHTHSSASDGVLSPQNLLAYAAEQGITLLALTDHDTVAGLVEGAEAAKQFGINFVPGIEFTIQWRKQGDFHLLGLGIQDTSALQQIIQNSQILRENRNLEIIEKMHNQGIPVSLEELREMSGTSSIGRPHFADYLVANGLAKTRQIAFDRFLSKGGPCYAEHTGENLEDAIQAIIRGGGLPVLAHPMSLYVSWGKIENILTGFREQGIAGIEAWHSSARVCDCRRLEKLADKLGLFITAGSDFHEKQVPGVKKPGIHKAAAPHGCKIGYTAGGMPIEERFLPEKLKKILEKQ
jgi:predicted metal-dependent phosphoesterase TrpH